MSIIKKPYELSLWQDDIRTTPATETRIVTFGSDQMSSQSRALDVKLTVDINGTHQLTFKMYYRYCDNETGEWVDNYFASLLTNESKIKLKYDDEWYDFIIKNIVENSNDYSFSYTATDLFINELSKTGFDLVFDDELYNNIGSARELISTTLEGTDWTVGNTSEIIAQINKENLCEVASSSLVNSIVVYELIRNANGAVERSTTPYTIQSSSGKKLYLFYSCIANQTSSLQLLLVPNNTPEVNSERIITNGAQYIIDNITYIDGIPTIFQSGTTITPGTYCGERFVWTQESKYDSKLQKVLLKYSKNGSNYWGYSDTHYDTSATVYNLVSNHKRFSSSDGWLGVNHYFTFQNPPPVFVGDSGRISLNTYPDIQQRLDNNMPLSGDYLPLLKATLPVSTSSYGTYTVSGICNTGPRDMIKQLGDINLNDRFIVYYKLRNGIFPNTFYNGSGLIFRLGALSTDSNGKLAFEPYVNFTGTPVSIGTDNYYYLTDTSSIAYPFKELKSKRVVVLINAQNDNTSFYIEDFQLFRYVENASGTGPLIPDEYVPEAVAVTDYYYFPENAEYTSIDDIPNRQKHVGPDPDFTPILRDGCEKIRSIKASESNRFNIIQDICETFECWAEFKITHTAAGAIQSKEIVIHNYIGQDNPVEFTYGINLKTIQRTLNSDQIVSKLIVKSNSNEYAEGGFCTITNAKDNEIKDNIIFNFDYYINKDLIDADDLVADLYSTPWTVHDDINNTYTYNGYFNGLKAINTELLAISNEITSLSSSITTAQARISLCEVGIESATDELIELNTTISKWRDGITYQYLKTMLTTDPIYLKLKNGEDDSLKQWFVECSVQEDNQKQFELELNGDPNDPDDGLRGFLESLQTRFEQLSTSQDSLIAQKKDLNCQFFKKYSRFIQEGTWIDESYTDPSLYYYDAQSVGYESAFPKVTYQLNVIDISALEEYAGYTFKLGDRTYIQDTEFFGYTYVNNVKTPAREAVIISKLVYALDDPSANTITIQTYKNLFQDLFHRITATVQQVHYATGSYERAAALAEADTKQKLGFLQDALNDAAAVLTNMAEQTVVWDSTGITITDGNNPSQKLRIVSGGILLQSTDAQGQEEWKVGLTAKGLSANLITAGQVNTAVVQIMDNNQPTFRWDVCGITAYDFTLDGGGNISTVDTEKGVRFDRFGIYGYTGIDGCGWRPNKVVTWNSLGQADITDAQSIRAYSIFELTKEGLYLRLAEMKLGHYRDVNNQIVSFQNLMSHSGIANLGKTEDLLYNTWGDLGIPYYDPGSNATPFVKVFSIGQAPGGGSHLSETFAIYDDGTLVTNNIKMTGSIEWQEDAFPSRNVYGKADLLSSPPGNNTRYSTFYNNDDSATHRWHKVSDSGDTLYCHTDNAGDTWEGPYLLSGTQGQSACSLSLSEDFTSYGTGPNPSGTISVTGVTTTISAYEGITPITNITYTTGSPTTDWTIKYTVSNVTVTRNGATFTINTFQADRGSILFELYKDTTKVAEVSYEISANKQGEPGEVWYINFPNGDSLVEATSGGFSGTITAQAYKRDSTGVSTLQNVYWKLNNTSIAPSPLFASNTLTLTPITGGINAWTATIASGITSASTIVTTPSPVAGVYTISAYLESTYQTLFDQETITLIPKGNSGTPGANGNSVRTQDVYFYTDSLTIPVKPDTGHGFNWIVATAPIGASPDYIPLWTTFVPGGTYSVDNRQYPNTNSDHGRPYVFMSQQTEHITYSNGVATTVYTATEPQLYEAALNNSALNADHVGRQRYATMLTLTNGLANQGIYYKSGSGVSDGNLYINATYINTGALTVSDGTNTVFSANVSSGTVQIGGFTINQYGLYGGYPSTNPTEYVGFCLNKSASTNRLIFAGSPTTTGADSSSINTKFYVTNDGEMHATYGSIGLWTISDIPTAVTQTNKDRYFYVSYQQNGVTKIMGFQNPVYSGLVAMTVGATSWDSWSTGKFYVTFDGKLYAKEAEIAVTTMGQEAKIGSWHIGNPRTDPNAGTMADRYFYADGGSNGNVLLTAFQNPAAYVQGIGATAFAIGATRWDDWSGAKFSVLFDGTLKAQSALLTNAKVQTSLVTEGSFSCYNLTMLDFSNLKANKISGPTGGGGQEAAHLTYTHAEVVKRNGSNFTISVTFNSDKSGYAISDPSPYGIYIGLWNNIPYGATYSSSINIASSVPAGSYINAGSNIRTYEVTIADAQNDQNWVVFYNNSSVVSTLSVIQYVQTLPRAQIQIEGSLIPTQDDNYNLGGSATTLRWDNIYATSGAVNSSDRKLKNNITEFTSQYEQFFDLLQPIKYKFINGTSGRTHSGFISQDVLSALTSANLTPTDFAGYCYDQCDDGTEVYSLRYSEFIALNTWQIQKLKARVSELEQRCELLEQKLLNK